MKKIFILLISIILCGCQSHISLDSNLSNLGYSEEEIEIILSLEENDRSKFYEAYDNKYKNILLNKDFNIDYLDKYLMYYKDFDADELIYLVNNNIINNNNKQSIKFLSSQKYFVITNIKKYLEYQEEITDVNQLISYVNTKAYRKEYEEYELTDISKDILMLANKRYFLSDYVPDDLVDVGNNYGVAGKNQKLREACYNAFVDMCNDASKDNIVLFITSAYRPYKTQVKLFNSYLNVDNINVVDTYSSRPGYSDHQTGLAIDILSPGYNLDTFVSSNASKWLNENAYKYGFILRYPKDKTILTGYTYEPWHYRYVGEDVAKLIYEHDICFEEYYAFYEEYLNNKEEK